MATIKKVTVEETKVDSTPAPVQQVFIAVTTTVSQPIPVVPTPTTAAVSEEFKTEHKLLLKGPRPKGLKRFKPIVEQQEETPYEELSENQKRKMEKARQIAEELARKAIEDELARQAQAVEVEKQAKLQKD